MVVTRTIRNRFVGDEPARGFESHLLRQFPLEKHGFCRAFLIFPDFSGALIFVLNQFLPQFSPDSYQFSPESAHFQPILGDSSRPNEVPVPSPLPMTALNCNQGEHRCLLW